MVKLKIPIEILDRARQKAEDMGELKNSIRKGSGNVVGFLGELMVEEYLKQHGAIEDNTYNYDISFENIKLEIKTKERRGSPKPEYDCSIAKYNTKQQCDWYFFVSIDNNHNYAWLLGAEKKADYFAKAREYKKGDIDPSNGFVFKADCFNVAISELSSPEDFRAAIINEKR